MNIKQFVEQSEERMRSMEMNYKKIIPLNGTVIDTDDAVNVMEEKLRELIGEVRKITDTLLHYVEHDSLCIRAKQNAGRPTEDGGYEEKFGDIWYESRPVDKTPECDCGLESVLHLLDETK